MTTETQTRVGSLPPEPHPPVDGRNRLAERYRSLLTLWLPALFVVLGAVVRLRQFGQRRSLWIDEVWITDNILRRHWTGLFQPLDHDQGAPVGWLLAEKLAVRIVGPNEYGLRIVALLSALALLVVAWDAARRMFPAWLVPLAVAAVATAPYLIRYSSEAKQYETDALVLVVLLDVTLILRARPEAGITKRVAAGWALLDGVAVVSSHLVNLVLPLFVAVLLLQRWRRRERRAFAYLFVGSAVAGLVVIANYLLLLRKLGQNEYLRNYWVDGLAPHPIRPSTLVPWLGRVASDYSVEPLRIGPTALVVVLLLVGLVALARWDRVTALLVAIPTFVLLAAAVAGALPFSGRLILGTVPFVLFAMCAVPLLVRSRAFAVVGVLLVGVAVLVPGLNYTVTRTVHPLVFEDLRPILQEVATLQRPGDVFLVDDGAAPAYGFYAGAAGLPAHLAVRPTKTTCDLRKQLADAGLAGHRVWFITGHRLLSRYFDVDQTNSRLRAAGAVRTIGLGSNRAGVLASATAYEIPAQLSSSAGDKPMPCLRIERGGP